MISWVLCLHCRKLKPDFKCVKYACDAVYCVKCDNKLKRERK